MRRERRFGAQRPGFWSVAGGHKMEKGRTRGSSRDGPWHEILLTAPLSQVRELVPALQTCKRLERR